MGGAGVGGEGVPTSARRVVPLNRGGASLAAVATVAPRNSSSSTVSRATGDDVPAALTEHCAPGPLLWHAGCVASSRGTGQAHAVQCRVGMLHEHVRSSGASRSGAHTKGTRSCIARAALANF